MTGSVRVVGRKHTLSSGELFINTTSRAREAYRVFSPFYLGPVKLYGSYTAQNLENAWQFSKVYEEYSNPAGLPSDKYFEWALKGWSDKWAHRYPMGKGRVPLFSWWNGEKLSYVEARKKIYCPLYAECVEKLPEFKILRESIKNGTRYVLWDFDSYDPGSSSFEEVMNDPVKKMGHSFVLAGCLTDNRFWEN